jgi:serine/threonine protein kinase
LAGFPEQLPDFQTEPGYAPPSLTPFCTLAETGPQEFGKYVLLSKLAAGGMAVTFRARLTGAMGVTKPCVIKQILPHFADDPDFVEMFASEARVAMALTHGNIAQVFDFGQVDSQLFLAMEFVYGQPLSKVLRRAAKEGIGFFPVPMALHIVAKMCDGLDYAHRFVGEDGQALGLVHRDVSPDNVLISYEGEVKVIDFGIAKATSVVEQKTSPGVVKGKYPYFSPEQAQGRQDLDARTDVYAAGVVLYEAVCGRRPFEGEFVTVLPRILTGDFAPPSQVNPAVSPELEDIIYRAMALDREERYPTAKALSDELVELLYRENPRFTPTLISQLVAHLFTEELTAEGRKVELPPGFKEQVASWKTTNPSAYVSRPGAGSGSGGKRTPGSGSRTPSGSVRTSNVRSGSVEGRPASEGGGRPGSGNVRTPSGARRVTNPGNGRRVTNPGVTTTGVRRALAERQGSPLPEAPPRRAPVAEDETPAQGMPSLAMPLDMPVEDATGPGMAAATDMTRPSKGVSGPLETVAAPPSKIMNAPLAAYRAAQAKEEATKAEQRQKLVRNISIGIFVIVAVLVAIILLRPKEEVVIPTTAIWVTSKPEGATIKLNDRDVKGKTPLFVDGFVISEANTLVLTLPGYTPWIKRITPNGTSDPQVVADLQRASTTPLPPTPPVNTVKAAEADAGTDGADGGTDAGTDGAEIVTPDGDKIDFHQVDYPARVLVLRPAYNAVPVLDYSPATIELSPGVSYSVSVEGGSAAYTEGGPTSNNLVYFLEGDLDADDTFGVLTGASRVIKGARKMHVFALDETGLEDNRGTIRIQFTESKWKPPRYLVFDAQKHAMPIKPEHQVVLRGLNPKSTYLFTVRDDFAELRPSAKGRIRRALCMERGANPLTARRTYRILETRKRYELDGLETLRCTFPDMKVTDNEGALEVDLVDVTNMTRKQREEYIRNNNRAPR